MFCPSCGQSQAPEAARFCPRCGFPQHGVAALLNAGGQWPEAETPQAESPRKRGVKQGVLMLFLGMMLLPILAITNFPEELVALSAIICFLGGILRILYAAIFEEGKKASLPPMIAAAPPSAAYTPPGQPLFTPAPPVSALPPPQQTPLPTSVRRPPHDTQEIINQPGSVTEHTTRMLKRETE
jgi:hypothetical protein